MHVYVYSHMMGIYRCKSIRVALVADDHDVRDDGDRKEKVVQRLDQALRRNDKTLKSYGLHSGGASEAIKQKRIAKGVEVLGAASRHT